VHGRACGWAELALGRACGPACLIVVGVIVVAAATGTQTPPTSDDGVSIGDVMMTTGARFRGARTADEDEEEKADLLPRDTVALRFDDNSV
jgi:hypothetical protein